MKDCGTCRECCLGTLTVEVKGVTYDNGTHCINSTCKGCTDYDNRPKSCVEYNCGWRLYDDMPSWMRPDKSRTLINRGTKEALFYKDLMIDYVIPIDYQIPKKVFDFLLDRAIKTNTPFRFLTPKKDGYTMGAVGDNEFKQFVADQGMPS